MKQISRLVIYILMAVCEILWKKPKWVFQRVWDVFFGMSDVSSCKQLPEPLAWCDTDEDTRLITPKAQREIKLEPESKPELERESEIKIYPPTPSGVSKQPDGSSDNRKDRRISRLIIEVLFRHLNRRRQRQFWLVVCLMLIAASFEVFSLGVVLPFIGILAAPDRVYNYSTIASLVRVFGITSPDQLVLPLTVAFAAVSLMAGSLRILVMWVSTKFSTACGSDISTTVYQRALYQPYWVHVDSNSAEIISRINYVNSLTLGVLSPLLTLISSIILLAAITSILAVVDSKLAMVSSASLGACYVLITWSLRKIMKKNSQCLAHEQIRVLKALQEALGGIRDILLDWSQAVFCNIYYQSDRQVRRAYGNNLVLSTSPRYAIEAISMVLIAVLAYSRNHQPGGMTAAMPVIAFFLLGALRLLPILQQSYGAWASIAGNQVALAEVVGMLRQPLPVEALQPAPDPLLFKDAVHIVNVRFRYASDSPFVLDGINLTIHKGSRVGFVGSTGCGKSTLLDLLMGLLLPSSGEILVDDKPLIGNRIRAWQQTVAHVPQSIYLTDATLAENIAFGVPFDAIDLQRVRRAAGQARIADFIESRPEGYNAFVGERGVRLSGGQRQRIGIARALYKQASVLVFDEATSALDSDTARSVMDAIEGLSKDLTILIVSHNFDTVRCCGTIVEIKHGRVVAQGTSVPTLKNS